jgi:hypothetical protein
LSSRETRLCRPEWRGAWRSGQSPCLSPVT